MPTATSNIMMIGPTKAGKTTLLSVLRLAAARYENVNIRPVSREAAQLFERALDIADTGTFTHDATAEATEYVFELHCRAQSRVKIEHFEEEAAPGIGWIFGGTVRVDRSFFKVVEEDAVFTLTVLDGRGGDIFGERDSMEDEDEYNRRRSRLVDLASKSVALIICVNANDPKATGHFFRGLQGFLDAVHATGNRTPFERVAIAMTQADRLVVDFGSSAQMELQKRDPAQDATETLGFYAKSALFQALEPVARKNVYAGWVSVYGFIPNEGSVNFQTSANRIEIFRPDDARWLDDWHPLGVIDPFLFACTGQNGNLSQLKENAD
jgi:hypothetical protein